MTVDEKTSWLRKHGYLRVCHNSPYENYIAWWMPNHSLNNTDGLMAETKTYEASVEMLYSRIMESLWEDISDDSRL